MLSRHICSGQHPLSALRDAQYAHMLRPASPFCPSGCLVCTYARPASPFCPSGCSVGTYAPTSIPFLPFGMLSRHICSVRHPLSVLRDAWYAHMLRPASPFCPSGCLVCTYAPSGIPFLSFGMPGMHICSVRHPLSALRDAWYAHMLRPASPFCPSGCSVGKYAPADIPLLPFETSGIQPPYLVHLTDFTVL